MSICIIAWYSEYGKKNVSCLYKGQFSSSFSWSHITACKISITSKSFGKKKKKDKEPKYKWIEVKWEIPSDMLRLSSLTFLETTVLHLLLLYTWMLETLFLYVWNELFFTLSISKVNYAFHLSIYISINRAIRFKGYQQQDSQELLRYLLDGMRAEEIQVSGNSSCLYLSSYPRPRLSPHLRGEKAFFLREVNPL